MTPHPTITRRPADIAMPILDIGELGSVNKDRRSELPEDIQAKLMPWEQVVHINQPVVARQSSPPSTFRALMRLTGVSRVQDIGKGGPSLAAVSSEANKNIEALTKYEVPHGRDALQVAMDLHEWHPELLASTIVMLAEQQGVKDEDYVAGVPFRQEETGRIMLLNRLPEDEVGRRFSEKLGWGWPFYGSVDATLSYITAVATYVSKHDSSLLSQIYRARDGREHTISESFFSAIHWLLKKTEDNPDGLVEFKNKAPTGGMLNQAWKDSAGAYVHADGDWANHEGGIASIEVQARTYDAYINAALVYRQNFRNDGLATDLEARAANLRRQVLDKFWAEDEKGGYFVLGTDRDAHGNLRQMKVRTSNMGHLLNSEILTGDDPEIAAKRVALIRTLFSPAMLSPHGIRTLSSEEQAFRKEGYHTGSVWLWDNDYIAQGLERHGYFGLAWHLRQCTLSTVNKTRAFPEFVQGDDNPDPTLNTMEVYVYDTKHDALYLFEQLPQEIQAWSVSAVLATKYKYQLPKKATDPVKSDLEDELLSQLRRS